MNEKSKLHIQCNLNLSFPPVSIDDLTYLVDDPEFHKVVKDASLYIICQRPCLLFKNLEIINQENIEGEIFQTGGNEVIRFNLPLYQENIVTGDKRTLRLLFNQNHGFKSRIATKEEFALKEADNIELILVQEDDGKHIKYITPDVILERVRVKKWNCEVHGKLKFASTFNLHYIGESVKQPIWKRLKSHSKLQQILSREDSYYSGIKLSSELLVLIFRISDIYDTRILNRMNENEILTYIIKSDQINDSTIFYDVEKAFIKTFQPKYNIQRYYNYPESINGIEKESFNFLSYLIDEPMTLIYNDKSFKCGVTNEEVNSVFVDFDKFKTKIEKHNH